MGLYAHAHVAVHVDVGVDGLSSGVHRKASDTSSVGYQYADGDGDFGGPDIDWGMCLDGVANTWRGFVRCVIHWMLKTW